MHRHTTGALVLCLLGSIVSGADTPNETAERYARLKVASGAEYLKQRADFLARPDARAFLETQATATPDTYLTIALLARAGKRPQVEASDRNNKPSTDEATKRAGVGDLYDPATFARAFSMGYANIPSELEAQTTLQGEQAYDLTLAYALGLEGLLRNTPQLGLAERFWGLKLMLDGAPLKQDDSAWATWQELDQRGRHKGQVLRLVKPKQLADLFITAAREESEPALKLLLAARIPGDETARVLTDIAQQGTPWSVWAGLLYAARGPKATPRGHPFDGPWLEKWVKGLTANQLPVVEAIFMKHAAPLRREPPPPDNIVLGFPTEVLGLFLRYHGKRFLPESHNRYVEYLEACHQTCLNCVADYRSAKDTDGVLLEWAWDYGRNAFLWPASAAADLKKAATSEPKMKEILAELIARLLPRDNPYPTGVELNSLFSATGEE